MGNIQINTKSLWNQGSFNGTTADAIDSSGNDKDRLKIGYPSKLSDVVTTMPGYDNLLGMWFLDEDKTGESDTVNDYSGNDNHLTNGVTLGFDTGMLGGNAFQFSNDDDEVLDLGGPLLTTETAFSVVALVKLEDGPDNNYICSQPVGGSAGGGFFISLQISETKRAIVWWIGGSTVQNYEIPSELLGEWAIIVTTFDGTNARLYLNGDLVSQGTNTAPTWDSDPFAIGNRSDSMNRPYNSDISFLAVFNKAMTQEEAEQLSFNYQEEGKFIGDYESEIYEPEDGDDVQWDEIEVDANLPSGASCEITLNALDASDNVLDSLQIELNNGTNTYDISALPDSPKIQFNTEHEVDGAIDKEVNASLASIDILYEAQEDPEPDPDPEPEVNLINPTEGQEFGGFVVTFEFNVDTDVLGTAYMFINKPSDAPFSDAYTSFPVTETGVSTFTETVNLLSEGQNVNTWFVRFVPD